MIDTFNITNERISITEATEAAVKKYERTNTLCVQSDSESFMKVFDQNDQPISIQSGEIAHQPGGLQRDRYHESDRT